MLCKLLIETGKGLGFGPVKSDGIWHNGRVANIFQHQNSARSVDWIKELNDENCYVDQGREAGWLDLRYLK